MKPKCFIFDIDGTLADNSHRKSWVAKKPKNWVAYNKTMSQDTIIKPVAAVFDALRKTETVIVLCTGREEPYRTVTKEWLCEHDIYYDKLCMRKEKDYRDDRDVKRDMLREIEKDYDVIAVFDDRVKVVSMWREEGLFVFDCNQTGESF